MLHLPCLLPFQGLMKGQLVLLILFFLRVWLLATKVELHLLQVRLILQFRLLLCG